MTPPKASLIIAVYEKPEFLERILMSCSRQSEKNFEIIIADDGSSPAIKAVIDRFTAHLAIQHCWHENKGFRKTIIVNQAVMASQSPYLIFIDGDCILHHRFIERHYRNKKEGIVLAGRRVSFSKNLTEKLATGDISSGRFESPFFWWNNLELPKERKHGFYIPGSFTLENWFRHYFSIRGCNFSMYKSDFCALNGYDETIIGRGLEDINLQVRMNLKQLRCKTIVREALQYHQFHTSDPVPHSDNARKLFCSPQNYWAPNGITKSTPPPSLL